MAREDSLPVGKLLFFIFLQIRGIDFIHGEPQKLGFPSHLAFGPIEFFKSFLCFGHFGEHRRKSRDPLLQTGGNDPKASDCVETRKRDLMLMLSMDIHKDIRKLR